MLPQIKVVDFFCGCGGTSQGFRQAGMDILAGIDNDPSAAQSYQKNFPEAHFFSEDIRSYSPDFLSTIIKDRRAPLLFSGCAPCQPFSNQNRFRSEDDNRRTLLGEFGRMVSYWKPDYLFIENVPGVQRVKRGGPFERFLKSLKDNGYQYEYHVVSALHYGVPQVRKRLVLLASLKKSLLFPKGNRNAFPTVREWISDLPMLEAGMTHPDDEDHKSARLTELNLKRIRATAEGKGREDWSTDLQLRCHKKYMGHSDVYGRLAWDKPAATLTTKCTSYSNGRYGHPVQDRALSVREAACLQTFPRNYVFLGSFLSKARQIGNAVPPKMAESFAHAFLEAESFQNKEGYCSPSPSAHSHNHAS